MVENQTFSVDKLFEQESDKMAARNEGTKILPEVSKQMCGLKAGKEIELKICWLPNCGLKHTKYLWKKLLLIASSQEYDNLNMWTDILTML